jgi:preprotein translocase subunit SecE
VATARGNRSEDASDPIERASDPIEHAPDPIEHATPDVELAEAQLALGRPEYADAGPDAGAPADEGAPGDEPLDEEPIGDDADYAEAAPGGGGGRDYHEDDADLGQGSGGSGGRRGPSTAVSAPREHPGNRLVHFLQGSWRELQRVQWPDRRQVMQATGVVIGFVIVAGAFLGVADLVAQKIVKLILP